jgi:hypothetical protein
VVPEEFVPEFAACDVLVILNEGILAAKETPTLRRDTIATEFAAFSTAIFHIIQIRHWPAEITIRAVLHSPSAADTHLASKRVDGILILGSSNPLPFCRDCGARIDDYLADGVS